MNIERPYYIDIGYRPLIFYIVFGADSAELSVSRERHGVESFPKGLELQLLNRNDHAEYMDSLLSGVYGEMLKEKNELLFEQIKSAQGWAILSGEIECCDTLEYFKAAIGIVEALCEKNALGVLDLQTIMLYTAKEWHDKIFAAESDPTDHAIIMASRTESGIWVHTRGMRKFGRPDIGIENIPESDLGAAAEVAEQMIRYGAQGAVFTDGAVFCISEGRQYSVKLLFVPDFENDDFNNAYYTVNWTECVLRAENE